MAWGKGKSEKGQGGKLGHSNRDGWESHDEEKVIAKKQRRLEQKQVILEETTKIDENLRENVNIILQILKENRLEYEIHEFDSGAAMIDFRPKTDFYCIQMTEGKYGWSKVDKDTGLSTIPESGYLLWKDFKPEFDNIIRINTEQRASEIREV